MRLLFIHIIFLTSCVLASAQKTMLNKNSIGFGDQVVLTIDKSLQPVTIDFNEFINKDYGIDTNAVDSIADIQMLNIAEESVKDNKLVLLGDSTVVITMNVYSVGNIVIKVGEQREELKVNAIEAKEYAGIKEIEVVNYTPWGQYAMWAIGILLLAALLYFIIKRSKKKPNVATVETIITPYEKALNELKFLKDSKAYENPEVKEFQDQLTTILRDFFEGSMQIPAKQMVTDQLVKDLKLKGITPNWILTIEELFSISDMVKFAKARPGVEICSEAIDKAIDFIINTSKK